MKVEMDLYNDWIETVKEIFRGSGAPLPQDWSAEEVGREYYLQTSSSEEEAEERRKANEQRLTDMQRTLLDNMETVVVPDIREKTGYGGSQFRFRWIYSQGEHIVEECSQYRIPLGPSPE
ncbi:MULTISPECIES: hypothetical protein [Paenibacillus]|uniref:hypothetical protein n=1 Tax=Paenibacillus TaxID=44249 RepID=UPI00020D6CE5|nr:MULTISPECIES: hypothetical protein [Paenibacillus]EGL19484.1 hypothetical protein HMPREF9413_4582 [Paenibacillus sp. HGF7]EPD82646.1 hypothetical protein HMPREF1207_03438 [Paenibacillus sp. HGH0039]MBV6713587.1 hypothetical protein [Paenibacillus chitinolyticus]